MVYPMEVFLFVALVYFVFCLALDLLANAVSTAASARKPRAEAVVALVAQQPPLPAS